MLQRTEGIVLRTLQYGEADLIVTYLTKDLGIVKVFARSPRKTKSRFGSSLEPLTCSVISFWGKEDAALPRLTQADILHAFSHIRESLHCFLKASELIELTMHLVPERDKSRNVYSLLVSTLSALEEGCKNQLIALFYKLRLLDMTGFLPSLQACGRCGGPSDAFHYLQGTVLCGRCSPDDEMPDRLSPRARTFSQSLLKWDISKLDRLKPAEGVLRELALLIDEHARYVIGKNLRTKAFKA
jgi:DNA repair protein RecO (recombination protein O)